MQLLAALFPLPPAPIPVEGGGLGAAGALEMHSPLGKEELWGRARVALLRDVLGLSFKRKGKIVIKDQNIIDLLY